jgi:hypothetical protein
MLLLGALYCVFLWAVLWSGLGGGSSQKRRTISKETWSEKKKKHSKSNSNTDDDVVLARDTLGTNDRTDVVIALYPANYRDAYVMDEDVKEHAREVVRAQVRETERSATEPLASRLASRNREALELSNARQRDLREQEGRR